MFFSLNIQQKQMKNFPQSPRGKLTSLFASQRRYSRSGSITTTVDKQDDIRSSRIINLPNYKRETLECRLDFVVVFQTIEIERLSLQIESLRVRLLDSERQIFNYKNYEVQIRQLTQRCFEYQIERSKYEQEINRMMLALKQTEENYEEARDRAAAFEDQLRQREDQIFRFKEELIIQRKQREQVEDFRLQLQSNLKQKQKAYSRQLRQLEKSTQSRRNDLSKNEENLNQLLRKYQEEIKDLRKENANLRAFYDSIQQQSKDLQARYEDLQDELAKTADALREKEFQLQHAEAEGRQRLEILQARYQEECNEKARQLEDGQNEVAELRAAIDQLEIEAQRYQTCISDYQQKKEKYQMFLNEAGDEIDRLNTIIKDKNKYLEAWQTRYKELEGKNSSTQQQLIKNQQKIVNYQQEISKLTHTVKSKTDQLQKLQRQRQHEMKQVKDRLAEAETARGQLAAMIKQKQHQRQQSKRIKLQNNQLKQQLNRRVAQSNKIFEDLHRLEADNNKYKSNNSQLESAVRERDDQLKRISQNLQTINTKCDKLLNQKRGLQQELVKMKSLQQKLKHQESKKNEYLNEGKKLLAKVKELQKSNNQKKLSIQLNQKQLAKYTQYARQAEKRIEDLEEQLEMMLQFKRELTVLTERNKSMEQQIKKLASSLSQKTSQLHAIKDKVMQYQKFLKQLKIQQQRFKQEVASHERILSEMKQLKNNYNKLQDENMNLQNHISKLQSQKAQALKEVSNLEKVITINAGELKRIQQQLAEAKQEIAAKKDNQKTLFTKIKQAQKKIKSAEGQLQKEKHKLAKDRAQFQKQFDKKAKELQTALKNQKQQKQKLIQIREKLIKEKEMTLSLSSQKNQELKQALRKNQQQLQKIFRYSKQLQKKIVGVQHELERLTAKNEQTTKELQIAKTNYQKAVQRNNEQEASSRQQRERITGLIAEQQEMANEIVTLKETVRSKQTDIGHLIEQCRQYKEEMALLFDQVKEHGEIHSQQIAQIMKIKFQSENILEQHNAMKVRLSGLQTLVSQLKGRLGQVLEGQRGLAQQKSELQKRVLEFQDVLMRELERFQQVHFRQNQEIIRLQTLNKILQIEVGEFKERESVMFSMVKEASIIKEKQRERESKVKRNSNKSSLATELTLRTMKESTIGEINLLSKKSRTTRIEDDEDQQGQNEQREGIRSKTILKGSKNRIHFENLVFKNI